jgi:hypothetical protein
MRFAGCAATSHEIAAVSGGDDTAVLARGELILTEPGEALEFLAGLGVDAVRLRALGGQAGVGRPKRYRAVAAARVPRPSAGLPLCERARLADATMHRAQVRMRRQLSLNRRP